MIEQHDKSYTILCWCLTQKGSSFGIHLKFLPSNQLPLIFLFSFHSSPEIKTKCLVSSLSGDISSLNVTRDWPSLSPLLQLGLVPFLHKGNWLGHLWPSVHYLTLVPSIYWYRNIPSWLRQWQYIEPWTMPLGLCHLLDQPSFDPIAYGLEHPRGAFPEPPRTL